MSLKIFQNWRDIVGEDGEFRKTGFVRIVHPNEMDRLKQNVEMQRGLGAKVELIDRKQLQELEPDWKVDEVELAAYEPDSGYGDGSVVATDFLARARDMGVEYLPRTRATAFSVDRGHVRGVVPSGRILWFGRDWPVDASIICRSWVRRAHRARISPSRDPQECSGDEGRRVRVHRFSFRNVF